MGSQHVRRRLLRMALPGVIVVTLVAGLYPFSWARRNDVSWSRDGCGLKFESASMAVSDARLAWDTTGAPATLCFELWLAPAGPTDEATALLTLVDEPGMPVLLLMQTGEDLVVASRVTNADGERWYNDFVYTGALRGTEVRHVALASGMPHPRLQVNGTVVALASGYGIPLARAGAAMRGRLLLGCSPRASGSWRGIVRALVVHSRVPTDAEIRGRDVELPIVVEGLARQPGVAGAYTFCEGAGTLVRDHSPAGAGLNLPEYYRPIEAEAFQRMFPKASTQFVVLSDIAVNLIGFMPLGFFLALWLLSRGRRPPSLVLLVVVAACAAISFGIEWVQVLMPTRHSSMLDLLLNALGAALGVGAAFWVRARRRTAGTADAEPA